MESFGFVIDYSYYLHRTVKATGKFFGATFFNFSLDPFGATLTALPIRTRTHETGCNGSKSIDCALHADLREKTV